MFFRLAHQKDPNFPRHFVFGRLILNTDQGWHSTTIGRRTFVYKGYTDTRPWCAELLDDLQDHALLGNFAVFCFDSAALTLSLLTNRWRGFLIWHDAERGISNLEQYRDVIWNDSSITVNQDLSIIETKLDIIGCADTTALTRPKAVQDIDQIISERVRDFVCHNSLPLKVFCSGGVDSTLVWSYVKRDTSNYELVLENRVEWDEFWCRNQRRITSQFWAYQQIHHWRDSCVLTSGAPGDEFMFRSPTTVGLWCMYHGIDIFDLIRNPDCLHHHYFMQPKHQRLFADQQQDRSLDPVMRMSQEDFTWYLCNIIVNDCQHWHLGQTLTFTPLRDLRIFQTLLRMPQEALIAQMLDSEISRELIAGNDQSLLAVMSDIKNVGESLANMSALISR